MVEVLILPLVVVVVILLVIAGVCFSEKGRAFRSTCRLVVTGLESGFSIRQILVLGKIGKAAGLDDCSSLFWSSTALDKCTAELVRQTKAAGSDTDAGVQRLLSSLYAYRRKLDLEQARVKRGVVSTKDIPAGQSVRILLKGSGVFKSRVVANTPAYLKLEFPSSPHIFATEIDWLYKGVKVYFWRVDDAGYEFSSTVIPPKNDDGKAVIYLAHADNLMRVQMRKARRVKCSLPAQLYLMKDGDVSPQIEVNPGMKCILEDLSENGAMILIGGKAVKGMRIKLQFLIQDTLVIMTGVSRGVRYDEGKNRSHVNFECERIDPRMRNAVLSFVYNALPDDEKHEMQAVKLSEEDSKLDAAQKGGGTAEGDGAADGPFDAAVATDDSGGSARGGDGDVPDFAVGRMDG